MTAEEYQFPIVKLFAGRYVVSLQSVGNINRAGARHSDPQGPHFDIRNSTFEISSR
jgi:hypothetical protein